MTNINIGSAANDGTGDVLRTAFTKINSNFGEVSDDLTTLSASSAQFDADIVDIFDTLDNNESRIAALESGSAQTGIALASKVSMTAFNQTIANLNLTIASLNERILALENNQ